jgi:non-ribosomal peptide synthetase component F
MHEHVFGEPTCIGVPTPNNNVYVLGETMEPLPIGSVGVMWAGGAGVTKGYLNLDQKTRERYQRDPFANDGSVHSPNILASFCLEHM